MADLNFPKLVDDLLEQLTKYGAVHRKSTQPFTREKISRFFPEYKSHVDDEVIRESLLEHVGCLPIVASYLYPYLDHTVDLGKVLIMLAVHDIGELALGDVLTFIKTGEQDANEFDAGLGLLHEYYHPFYRELHEGKTNDARFVISVDKLAPDLFDILAGEEYSAERMVLQAGWKKEEAMENIRKRKRPQMEWSPFLTRFHDEIFRRFKSIKAN